MAGREEGRLGIGAITGGLGCGHPGLVGQGPQTARVLLGGHRDAEAPDAVAVAVVVLETERQPAAARIPGRILEAGDEEMPLAEAGADGPARLGVAVDGVLGAVVLLLPIGRGPGEEEVGVGRRGPPLRRGGEGEFIEDEVAGGSPATGSVLGQARVGEHLQHHGGDAGEVGVGLDGDRVVDRVHAGAQEGTVGEVGVARAAGGMGVDELEGPPGIGFPGDRSLPGGLARGQCLAGLVELPAGLLKAAGQVGVAVGQVRPGDLDRRAEAVVAGVGRVVEEGVEAVVLLVGDRVVLVRVALGAVQGETEPGRADSRHPILHRLGPVFLGVAAALVVDLGVPVEPGGDALGQGGLGQQVSGQLVDGEPVEGLVAIEGVDHPLAVGPDGPGEVDLITVGVGVARQVEPTPSHVLAVVGRGQEAVDQGLVGAVGRVGDEAGDLGRFRGQPGEVEREPAHEGGRVGRRLLLEALAGEAVHDEPVDGIADGRGRRHGLRGLGTHRCLECPMLPGVVLGPDRTLGDPSRQAGHLGRGQPRALGRHDLVRVVRSHPTEEFTGLGFARRQRHLPGLGRLEGRRPRIEAQAGLLLVRAMALGTAADQQRLDLGLEVGRRGRPGNQQGAGEQGDRLGKQGDLHGLWCARSLGHPPLQLPDRKHPRGREKQRPRWSRLIAGAPSPEAFPKAWPFPGGGGRVPTQR